MAGQVGVEKSLDTDTALSKMIGCQTSVQLYAPNGLSHNRTFLSLVESSYTHF